MTQPIRIVHLITGLNTGGAEIALFHLLQNMDREKFEMQVVCMIPVASRMRSVLSASQASGVAASLHQASAENAMATPSDMNAISIRRPAQASSTFSLPNSCTPRTPR